MDDSSLKKRYRPLGALSYVTMVPFLFLFTTSLITAILGIAFVIFHRDPFSPDESGPLAFVLALISQTFLVQPILFILAIVLLLIWTHRAYYNLSPLKARNLSWTPAWAVATWVIPFANLVWPFQMVRELWNGSDPDNEVNSPATRREAGTPDLLWIWWGTFIVSNFGIGLANSLSVSSVPDLKAMFPGLLTAAELLRATSAILLIWIIKEITRRQELRFRLLATGSATLQPPLPPSFTDSESLRNPGNGYEHSIPDQQQRQQEYPDNDHEVPEQTDHAGSGR
jgi:hypothetical protein